MKKIVMVLFLLLSVNASALIAPFWQSKLEIETILQSKELSYFFYAGEEIREIVKEGDFYLIKGTVSSCLVEVVYLSNELLGPAKFELIFHTP